MEKKSKRKRGRDGERKGKLREKGIKGREKSNNLFGRKSIWEK